VLPELSLNSVGTDLTMVTSERSERRMVGEGVGKKGRWGAQLGF
jgi:hypothetical protein